LKLSDTITKKIEKDQHFPDLDALNMEAFRTAPADHYHPACRSAQFTAGWTTSPVTFDIESRYRMLQNLKEVNRVRSACRCRDTSTLVSYRSPNFPWTYRPLLRFRQSTEIVDEWMYRKMDKNEVVPCSIL